MALFAAVAAGATAPPALGQCTYSVTVIQAPECGFGGHPATVGVGLNGRGDVVGYQIACGLGDDLAFRWTPEDGYQVLPMLPGAYSMQATDINDSGTIVGWAWVSGLGQRGWIYDSATQEYTIIEPAFPGVGWSWAHAISDSGFIVGGRSITEDGINPYNAFLWSPETGFNDLGVMQGLFSSASDVSESGVVVGWTGSFSSWVGFVWEDGELTILDPFPGGYTSWVTGVSPNSQHRVGNGWIEAPGVSIKRPFLLKGRAMSDLGSLPGHSSAAALSVNEAGQVCGASWIADQGDRRAVLWQSGTIHDLTTLSIGPPGMLLEGAVAINAGGQMIAGRYDSAGDVVVFLLTPIDRPQGDITIDCRVDVDDLLLVVAEWGESIADLNGDGTVGFIDMLIVLTNWTSIAP